MGPISIIIKLWNSLIFSLRGFVFITKFELSFQLELIYAIISFITLYFMPFTLFEKLLLILTLLLLLIIEIFNTIIEMITDHLSPEESTFARTSKDLGSTAVFLILMMSFIQWGIFLWSYFLINVSLI